MTKSEFVLKLADQHSQLEVKDIKSVVKVMLNAMAQSLSQGQRVEIRGFGSFDLNYRSARTARNPKSGEKIQIAGKYALHFKAGKKMREQVNYK
ncbi:MAG: integration host factor subunit beta [Nitrosospira sp.]|nr:integration host factor subunit beta [Nitrosospira sp.]